MKNLAIGCGVVLAALFGLVFIGLFGLGYALEQGYMPDTLALPKGQIHPRYIQKLEDMQIIEPGEEVQFFYSAAMTDIADNGNLFTDKRVIVYNTFDDETQVQEATYSEIESIQFEQSQDWVIDSTIAVNCKNGEWFMLSVSIESGRDKLFYERLQALVEKHKSTE